MCGVDQCNGRYPDGFASKDKLVVCLAVCTTLARTGGGAIRSNEDYGRP